MTRAISWKPYLWDAPRPAGTGEIELLEREWGVTLPGEYKKLISANQGMAPSPCIFNVGRVEDVMSVLLTLITEPKHESYSIRDSYRILKQHIPARILPFALTPGSEHLCFDYRDSSVEPRIVLVTAEMYVHPIANSFSEFLAQLHE